MPFLYRQSMIDLLDDLNDLMADLEDIRDEAQDCLEQTHDPTAGQDVKRMDEALRLLNQAADLLDINAE
ncbi:MAG: hypothetical protein GX637_00590 [Clostridiales bacterium]|nr:hypothetical protein [Clostridiales bacterium]